MAQERISDPRWKERITAAAPLHIAVMVEPYLSLLLSGRKTIESRITKNRAAPWRRIAEGDVVLLKKSGGGFCGVFTAGNVVFEELTHGPEEIRRSCGDRICAGEEFWAQKADARYATLIPVENLLPFEPFSLPFPNRQSWIFLP